MNDRQLFHSLNSGYIQELYEQYRADPASVPAGLRALFAAWSPQPAPASAPAAGAPVDTIVAAANLAYSIRTFGHMDAQLDPLGTPPPGDPSLTLEFHGLTEADLRALPASLVGGPLAEGSASAWEAILALRRLYGGRISYGYSHIRIPEERQWLLEAAEGGTYRPPRTPIDARGLLERLSEVEAFEQFMHHSFPGKTRFSIEGLDMLIPMLDEIIAAAAASDVASAFIGMAHRGRLNVLAHVLHKPYDQILAEFKDPLRRGTAWDAQGWTGDVGYHAGGQRAVGSGASRLVVRMPSNPSHLEHIDPVLVGMARAAITQVDHPGAPVLYPDQTLPILIHGDASFAGEGIVFETLNLSALPGYTTGGTVHIITNNQLGFTAAAPELRSSLYVSDLAKGLRIPVIYVNADDPEACIEAARTAFAYRERFHKDFLIDLIGYRRYGHNEGDEPGFTQPVMYRAIQDHPSVRTLWAGALVARGAVAQDEPEALLQQYTAVLHEVYQGLRAEELVAKKGPTPATRRTNNHHGQENPSLEELRGLNAALLQLPAEFTVHPRLKRVLERRKKMLDDPGQAGVDWAEAEVLAFAAILKDGVPIRLTGEDVGRGTFSQRHAVLNDYETGKPHVALQALPQARAAFEVHNSPLTENATIGFEYGYNIQAPERLVIWEAQYGDFVNVAQPILDEFVVSARDKWGLNPSLVLLLPHGNEGQGPDHSSARPERLLQMAAEDNLRLAYPTTAAQYYHLLRRQAGSLASDPAPLIVLTHKGLLRHPRVSSRPADLVEGGWQPVLDDERYRSGAKRVRRLLLCTGRIYVDLMEAAVESEEKMAIVRLEQLYPFPDAALQAVLARYPAAEEVAWVQEEPRNMGAWSFVQPQIDALLAEGQRLSYLGRPPSSSPAEGSGSWYAANQKAIVAQALTSAPIDERNSTVQERG